MVGNYFLKSDRAGFTIVELLIVIVVIGILAAITIVGFNGIQNRTHDTAVQSDLRNLAVKIREQEALTGSLPTGANSTITGITSFPVSKGSYATDTHNLYYCTGTVGGAQIFGVAAKSKSGKVLQYHSNTGAGEFTGTWGYSSGICPGLGIASGYTYGLGYNKDSNAGAGGWYGWTG